MTHIQTLSRDNQPDLAYMYTPSSGGGADLPVVIFLGGFKSDMAGTKAQYFEDQCIARGQAYLRLDYSGHGESGGAFVDGTISQWRDDALAVIDHCLGEMPFVLVGSSMGGWISLLFARDYAARVLGVVGIAAAPDFTEKLTGKVLNDEQRLAMESQGCIEVPNDYSDEPYIFTRALYEDGKANLLLQGGAIDLGLPIHLVQGKRDVDVPWETAEKIKAVFGAQNVRITYIDDGDHRLSNPEELKTIWQAIDGLLI